MELSKTLKDFIKLEEYERKNGNISNHFTLWEFDCGTLIVPTTTIFESMKEVFQVTRVENEINGFDIGIIRVTSLTSRAVVYI